VEGSKVESLQANLRKIKEEKFGTLSEKSINSQK
jgi:hypothetical protein